MKNKMQITDLKNKDMNPATYALRRKVMAMIYEAKALAPSLPRVDIRITEDDATTLGLARMGNKEIWITSRAVDSDKFDLRTIVFHELVHAVYGIDHDETCKLMRSTHKPLAKAEAERLFKKYAK
jgi:hypothetical protein